MNIITVDYYPPFISTVTITDHDHHDTPHWQQENVSCVYKWEKGKVLRQMEAYMHEWDDADALGG